MKLLVYIIIDTLCIAISFCGQDWWHNMLGKCEYLRKVENVSKSFQHANAQSGVGGQILSVYCLLYERSPLRI